jgi:hypothetical protein
LLPFLQITLRHLMIFLPWSWICNCIGCIGVFFYLIRQNYFLKVSHWNTFMSAYNLHTWSYIQIHWWLKRICWRYDWFPYTRLSIFRCGWQANLAIFGRSGRNAASCRYLCWILNLNSFWICCHV